MDSVERLVRKNALKPSRLFNNAAESDTVYHRVETLAGRDRFVGFPYYALKEAFYSPEARNILIVDYDLLAQAPARVIPLIYSFLGEPEFAHDFENLDYQEPEFDARIGVQGLHEVKRKVALRPRQTVLPPDLFGSSLPTIASTTSAGTLTITGPGASSLTMSGLDGGNGSRNFNIFNIATGGNLPAASQLSTL